ncbi:CAP domain-containing protein [Sporolactobacillus kofuensis]|uniref:CAP domain-containing protein n=1 Tax=Sporolactobacillus kofuensis TaxID=269672 RepID=A0ABW1WEK2_9BACL|nr:CAP domain-containing protein [Sporolactobacillus kofuensis]MCO7174596.1 CAP domain-containing protein [Sporolactobacillus kofuensis]
MRKTNIIIFVIAVIVFAGTFIVSLISLPSNNEKMQSGKNHQLSANFQTTFKVPNTGVHKLMGKSKKQIVKLLGTPERIDPTKFGYRWFIYGRQSESYLQVGIDNSTDRVTTVYALGNKLKTNPFVIGADAQNVYAKVPIADELSLSYKGTKIDFELNEEDMMVRPLMKFGNYWVQLNFDHLSDRLIGIRYLTTSVLVKQHPYSMTYQGQLPESPVLSNSAWNAIDKAENQEIFDISNVLRMRYGKKTLDWNEQAYKAAYQHSKEMKIKDYFSHDSKWSGDLRTRLEKENITFQVAGENIAAKYPDAIAVSLGWLNSVDHRENLLNEAFSELGVGSYQNYYTQDFVKP